MAEDPEAKRRRIESEQRAAFEEDMARVRAAIGTQDESSRRGDSGQAAGATPGQNSQQQVTMVNSMENKNETESDDEEGEGNWLKNFTSHHTRIGAEYQVTDLPTPSPKKIVGAGMQK